MGGVAFFSRLLKRGIAKREQVPVVDEILGSRRRVAPWLRVWIIKRGNTHVTGTVSWETAGEEVSGDILPLVFLTGKVAMG